MSIESWIQKNLHFNNAYFRKNIFYQIWTLQDTLIIDKKSFKS